MTDDAVYFWVSGLFYIGILSVPLLMLVALPYEQKTSEDTRKPLLSGVPLALIFFVSSNWLRTGFAFDKWYWSVLCVIPVMMGFNLFLNWSLLRHGNKRTGA